MISRNTVNTSVLQDSQTPRQHTTQFPVSFFFKYNCLSFTTSSSVSPPSKLEYSPCSYTRVLVVGYPVVGELPPHLCRVTRRHCKRRKDGRWCHAPPLQAARRNGRGEVGGGEERMLTSNARPKACSRPRVLRTPPPCDHHSAAACRQLCAPPPSIPPFSRSSLSPSPTPSSATSVFFIFYFFTFFFFTPQHAPSPYFLPFSSASRGSGRLLRHLVMLLLLQLCAVSICDPPPPITPILPSPFTLSSLLELEGLKNGSGRRWVGEKTGGAGGESRKILLLAYLLHEVAWCKTYHVLTTSQE